MLRFIKKVFYIIGDREAEFDHRMFNLVIISGVVSAFFGTIVCALAHVPLQGIMCTAAIFVGALVLCIVGNLFPKTINACKVVLLISISFLIPGIWITAGGINSGVNIWFVYGLVYICLMYSGKNIIFPAMLFISCNVATYIAAYFEPAMVWAFDNERDKYISIYGSVGTVGIILFITIQFYKIIYMEEQRISAIQKKELEEANESQKSFFANISHEIRTPINTIIGLNEMNLREENDSEEIQENCENIQAASKMLLSLINDVLDISKLQSGKMDIVPEKYEFASILSDLVNMIWVRANDKGLEFKLDVSEEIPSVLYGDVVRIKQILINLLTNAVKYTEKGSITLTITGERISHKNIRLNMAVSDTGIGIKKEDMKYLFDSFKRVDQQKTKYIEGTGLGLSITSSLAELMGGQIKVDSIYQQGSTFTFVVDQEIFDDAPIGAINKSLKKRQRKTVKTGKYVPTFVAPEAKVLVVDDNKFNQIVAKKLLSATEINVDIASSGKECLDKAMQKHYDVIFMDHMMPEMDGIETLNELRKRRESPCVDIPVVALTANAGTGLEEFYLQQGFQGYLVKPISGELLEKTLKSFLPAELVHNTKDSEEEYDELDDIEVNTGRVYKKKLIISADSVCDIPKNLIEMYDIRIMSYFVESDEHRYREGKEIWPENIFEFLDKQEGRVKSCPPEIDEYEKYFGTVLGDAEQIIHVCMTSSTSGGYANAVKAAESFDNVYVVDSEHLTTGMGLVVLEIAKMAKNHFLVDEILKTIPSLRKRISTTFMLPTPEYLYRAGRISGTVNRICKILSLYPVLALKKGKMQLSNIYGGNYEKAYREYVRDMLKKSKNLKSENLFVTFCGCSLDQRNMVKREVTTVTKFTDLQEADVSCAISANCGPGTIGIIYLNGESEAVE